MEINKTFAIAALAGIMSISSAAAQAEETAAPEESNGCQGKDEGKEANSCDANTCEANACKANDESDDAAPEAPAE